MGGEATYLCEKSFPALDFSARNRGDVNSLVPICRHDESLSPPQQDLEAELSTACFPQGEVGIATVATRMASSFPSIKFGLMVGIGAGVPPAVRLGDVVPAGGFGGVVQWDFGEPGQGDTFKRTGTLNGPPSGLRAVLTKLKTKHEMEDSVISKHPEDLKTNWPRLAAKYMRSKS